MSDKARVYQDGDTFCYRASSLGACTKALVAARVGYAETAPPDDMQRRFDDGHLHEPDILRRLQEEHGFELPDAYFQYEVRMDVVAGVRIVGHIDAMGKDPESGDDWVVVDAKALSRGSTDSWARGGFENWEHYAWQMSFYAYGLAEKWGSPKGRPLPIVMAVKNKDTGEMRVDRFPEPPVTMSRIKAKVLKVEGYARRGVLPEECAPRMWPCGYWGAGLCDRKEGLAETERVEDAALLELAEGYFQAAERERGAKKQKDELKPRLVELMSGREKVAVGSREIVLGKQTRRTLDKDAMKKDGIDVGKYEKETTSPRLEVR